MEGEIKKGYHTGLSRISYSDKALVVWYNDKQEMYGKSVYASTTLAFCY